MFGLWLLLLSNFIYASDSVTEQGNNTVRIQSYQVEGSVSSGDDNLSIHTIPFDSQLEIPSLVRERYLLKDIARLTCESSNLQQENKQLLIAKNNLYRALVKNGDTYKDYIYKKDLYIASLQEEVARVQKHNNELQKKNDELEKGISSQCCYCMCCFLRCGC